MFDMGQEPQLITTHAIPDPPKEVFKVCQEPTSQLGYMSVGSKAQSTQTDDLPSHSCAYEKQFIRRHSKTILHHKRCRVKSQASTI